MKTKLSFLICALLLALGMPFAWAAWTPPADRNTMHVIADAMIDRSKGRYADALEKLEWFYANANDAEHPIRRTTQMPYASSEWGTLAKMYAPAYASLIATRDRAEQRVREGGDPTIWFREVTMFNKELDDTARSIALFKWLHANKPDNAKLAFRYIDEQLIAAKEHKLAEHYIDANGMFINLQQNYRHYADTAALGNENSKDLLAGQKRYFENKSAMLVSLLVLNGKQKDAERIAKQARAVIPDPAFSATLDAALKGTMPVKDPNCDPKRRRC
ncbi:MAG: hypothetical protein JNN20_04870 [Betaproteobacteria bacterium]|nr:hypothetical protein [Betaproteobacteria bacterium]